jgi:hypothetical protein
VDRLFLRNGGRKRLVGLLGSVVYAGERRHLLFRMPSLSLMCCPGYHVGGAFVLKAVTMGFCAGEEVPELRCLGRRISK